jgi:hypothetical protein
VSTTNDKPNLLGRRAQQRLHQLNETLGFAEGGKHRSADEILAAREAQIRKNLIAVDKDGRPINDGEKSP